MRLHRNIYKYVDTHNFMTYTEIRIRKKKKYYYRVLSVRNGKKISKKRKYLGVNLIKKQLIKKEKEADNLLKVKNKRKIEFFKKTVPKIRRILKKNNIKKAGIFGSYARGEQKKNSDVDILIKPTKDMGFKFAGLEIELSKKLKKKIDLITYNGLSPYLKDKILKQEVRII